MALEGYDLKKELGETNIALAIKYGGRTIHGRSFRNWSVSTAWRRRADQAFHGSRRTAIRQLLIKFKDEPEEIDLATLPVGVSQACGDTTVAWQSLRQKHSAVDLSEIINDDKGNTELLESHDLSKLSDEQLMQLVLDMSTLEY